ncbi:hypothetical protein ACWGTI_03505 [Mesorhizobium sp. ArgA1]
MTTLTRRAALGAIASIPAIGGAVAATQASAVPVPQIPQDRLLYAYSQWLHFERPALMREIHPGLNPHKMMQYVPCNTHSQSFHFPLSESGLTWDTMPTPGTRALAVMTAAGVDLEEGESYAL